MVTRAQSERHDMNDGKKSKAPKRVKRGPRALVEARRDPSSEEATAIANARTRYYELPVRAQVQTRLDASGVTFVESQHKDAGGHSAMLCTAFGSNCHPFVDSALAQVMKAAGERGQTATEGQTNAALAFIGAVAPADEMEASIAVQMFATNSLAMEMLSRARHTSDRLATAEYTNMATKLSRTFIAQVEALSKLRRGGEQVVKYIHVHEGGQAVVAGTIHQGGRVNGKGADQPHEQATDAPMPALSRPDPARDGVPLASDAEREMLPARREEHRGAEGK